jgi:hypothetical protein
MNLGAKSSRARRSWLIPYRCPYPWHNPLPRCICHHHHHHHHHHRNRQHSSIPTFHVPHHQLSLCRVLNRINHSGLYHQYRVVHYRIGRRQGQSRCLRPVYRPRPTATHAARLIRDPSHHGTGFLWLFMRVTLTVFISLAILNLVISPQNPSAVSSANLP